MFSTFESKCPSLSELESKISIDDLDPKIYNILLDIVNSSKHDITLKSLWKRMLYYNITYSTLNIKSTELMMLEFDDNKETAENHYLFHGSLKSNWASILSNGLKNYSGTQNMRNGAAYGSGVYLSNNINLSQSYSQGDSHIIGVYRVDGKYGIYQRGVDIHVVPDSSKIHLHALILVKIGTKLHDLNKRLLELYTVTNQLNSVKRPKRIEKRIMTTVKELKLQLSDTVYILNNYQIKFTKGYPIEPPIVSDENGIVYHPSINYYKLTTDTTAYILTLMESSERINENQYHLLIKTK